jgi:radical SAM protein (TIGR01212 family)
MSSTDLPPPKGDPADWRAAGLRYHSQNFFYRNTFGQPVWKLSIDAGLNCPNRDHTLGSGGCVFCNPASFSPSRRSRLHSITQQIEHAIRQLRTRRNAQRFVAYFQPATNTYAPVDILAGLYREAIAHPLVVGLAIGTRPDCVPDQVLDLLADLSQQTWLSIEYGLQTIHDRTLDWMNRHHHYDAFLDAVARSRRQGLRIGAHVILGLPGESPDDMLATAGQLARLQIDSVKLHNLHAVRDTPLAEMVASGQVHLPALEEYVAYVVDFLELLPPSCVIDRLSADAPPRFLLAPDWCLNKSAVRAAILAQFHDRDTWQGRRFPQPPPT